MTTDITALAQSKALHKKLNRRLNDALGFQRTSGGKHATISLSINECKSVLSALDERFSLVEALGKAEAALSLENAHLHMRQRRLEAAEDKVLKMAKLLTDIKNSRPGGVYFNKWDDKINELLKEIAGLALEDSDD